jgi:uncharacterized delta-60 repeat protein
MTGSISRHKVSAALYAWFACVLCLMLAPAQSASAVMPGDPIPSYADGGTFSGTVGTGEDQGTNDFAMDSADRVVLLVRSTPGPVHRLTRLAANGSVDSSFGTGGVVELPAGRWSGMGVDADDRVVVSGSDGDSAVVTRYLPDGTLDTSFGTGGTWTTLLQPPSGSEPVEDFTPDLHEIRVLDDGTIAVAGDTALCESSFYQDESSCPGQVSLRLTPEGVLDAGFGDGGLRYTGLPRMNRTVSILSDGRTVLAGGVRFDAASGYTHELVVRILDKDGTSLTAPDPGGLKYGGGRDNHRGGATIDPGGRVLLVAGSYIFRYTKKLKADPTFSVRVPKYWSKYFSDGAIDLGMGWPYGPPWNDYLRGGIWLSEVDVDPKGRILVSGVHGADGTRSGFVARLKQDGQADPTFSNDGIALLWSGPQGPTTAPYQGFGTRVRLLNGNVVAAGTLSGPDGTRTAVSKLRNGRREVVKCQGLSPDYLGGPGSDSVRNDGRGVIVLLGGNDVVEAANSATVCAGRGDDRVNSRWSSRLFLGPGNDVAGVGRRGRGKDVVRGGPGQDRISTGGDDDTVFGGPGRDHINGGKEDDLLWGNGGIDWIYGRSGNDRIIGGPAFDRLRPGSRDSIEYVYTQKRGGFRAILMRRGDVLDTFYFRLTMPCEKRNRDGIVDGGTWKAFQSSDNIPMRGPNRQFRISFSSNSEGADYEIAATGREVGRTLVGRVRFVDRDPRTCWSGRSPSDPWVDFRAALRPVVRQTVRQ